MNGLNNVNNDDSSTVESDVLETIRIKKFKEKERIGISNFIDEEVKLNDMIIKHIESLDDYDQVKFFTEESKLSSFYIPGEDVDLYGRIGEIRSVNPKSLDIFFLDSDRIEEVSGTELMRKDGYLNKGQFFQGEIDKEGEEFNEVMLMFKEKITDFLEKNNFFLHNFKESFISPSDENFVDYSLVECIITDFKLRESNNFDIRILKSEAEYILNNIEEFSEFKGMDIMCKEYGDDNDWNEVNGDDLDEGELDDDYMTFDIYLGEEQKKDKEKLIEKINSLKLIK